MNSLELAIEMELDGKMFYLEQAEKNEDNALKQVFLNLAKEEQLHADILKKWDEKKPYDLEGNTIFEDYKNVFEDSDDFESEIRPELDLLDAYRLALKKEKESIDLYKNMLAESQSEDEEELFKFLIKEEKKHYNVLQEMITHLSRPEEWVESAEFGVRKKY